MEAKQNTTIQHLEDVKKTMSELKECISLQSKQQRLQWAIAKSDIGSFEYYDKTGGRRKSSDLVKEILLWFRRGPNCCFLIQDRSLQSYSYNDSPQKIAEKEKQFRDELVDQIHTLLGVEPRVVKEDDEYHIYYS